VLMLRVRPRIMLTKPSSHSLARLGLIWCVWTMYARLKPVNSMMDCLPFPQNESQADKIGDLARVGFEKLTGMLRALMLIQTTMLTILQARSSRTRTPIRVEFPVECLNSK
jgi:hypothetical protein